MPRDASGAYTPPSTSVSPAVPATRISSAAWNTYRADIENEIEDSLSRSGEGEMLAALDMGGFKVTNAGTPTASTDLATKGYVDTQGGGGTVWKTPVLLVSVANSDLTGEETIDGTLTSTDEVLMAGQTDSAENGVYTTGAGAWTRRTDLDTGAEFVGAGVFVTSGSTYGGSQWVCTNATAPTVGTDDITFVQIGASTSYTAGDGLDLTGTVFSAEIANQAEAEAGTSSTKLVTPERVTDFLEGGTLTSPAILNIGPQLSGDIDLTQHGCVMSGANGTETANNAAITAAIARAVALADLNATFGCAAIKIPPGVLRIDDPIEITESRILLVGAGMGATTIVMDDNTQDVIRFIAADGDANSLFKVGVRGMQITRVGASPSASALSDPANLRLENVKESLFFDFFINNYGNGIVAERAVNCKFAHFNIHGQQNTNGSGVGREGFAAFAFTSDATQDGDCTGNHVVDFDMQNAAPADTPSAQYGFLVHCTDGLYISNGHLHKFTEEMRLAPDGTTNKSTIGGLFVDRLYFDANFKYGLHVTGTATSTQYGRLSFDQCRFSGAAEWGSRLNVTSGTLDGIRITDSYWRANGIGGHQEATANHRGVEILNYVMLGNNTTAVSSGRDITIQSSGYKYEGKHVAGNAAAGGIALQVLGDAAAGTIKADLVESTMETKVSIAGADNGRRFHFYEDSEIMSEIRREFLNTTTDATPVAVFTLATSNGQSIFVDIETTGFGGTNTKAYHYQRAAAYHRVSGTTSEEWEEEVTEQEDTDDTTGGLALAVSGANIVATLTPPNVNSMTWSTKVRYRVRV